MRLWQEKSPRAKIVRGLRNDDMRDKEKEKSREKWRGSYHKRQLHCRAHDCVTRRNWLEHVVDERSVTNLPVRWGQHETPRCASLTTPDIQRTGLLTHRQRGYKLRKKEQLKAEFNPSRRNHRDVHVTPDPEEPIFLQKNHLRMWNSQLKRHSGLIEFPNLRPRKSFPNTWKRMYIPCQTMDKLGAGFREMLQNKKTVERPHPPQNNIPAPPPPKGQQYA